MRKFGFFLSCLFFALSVVAADAQEKYRYESVEGDPLKARIYTLDNGLKIYLTVNRDEPRIQTYVAVRVGGKNDPKETTGLAHYFEHLMFKGTTKFGTMNYEAEKPLLDSIEMCFERYRCMSDTLQRKLMYNKIDSLSYEASKYAIANEYDKLMAAIGATGTNAYTSQDVTCYMENIPSNEVENWAKIEAERFSNCVIRGFHTELEAVYEEKNISLTDDNGKSVDSLMAALFPHHPYGTQSVLGTQEQLKNPSITNIKNYYKQWYVPNNVAICMSGDFDYDTVVGIIDKYFGNWKPNPQLPVLKFEKEKPLTAPVVKTVYGPEAESVLMGWSFPGMGGKDSDYLKIISKILWNGKAGIFDLDLNQKQRLLDSGVFDYQLSDYSMLIAIAMPKEGQTLDELRTIMRECVAKVEAGDFDESLLQAVINNMKLERMKQLESNNARADMFVNAFVNGQDWKDAVEGLDRISRITKKDVMAFAKEYLTDGYACIYKYKGVDPNEKKMEKPEISPIEMNRDKTSDFVAEVRNSKVEPIEPVFVDFNKEIEHRKFKNGTEMLYKHNDVNGLFSVCYIFDRGSKTDKTLPFASDLLDYLGTSKMSAEELQTEFYKLACTMNINVLEDKTYVSVSGLAENMEKALALCEEAVLKAEPDDKAYEDYVANVLKMRADNKLNQETNFRQLVMWGKYGSVNESTNILSETELKSTDAKTLLESLRNLWNCSQTITYYGPEKAGDAERIIAGKHKMTKKPVAPEADREYMPLRTDSSEIYIAPYKAKNIYLMMFSNKGVKYDPEYLPIVTMYNEYFGGGMNSIVFQEMRESRGLAYSAGASYSDGRSKMQPFVYNAMIISQNDKLMDCVNTFNSIINDMPVSEPAFGLAKDALLKRLATRRFVNGRVLDYYLTMREYGIDHDMYKDVYNKVKTMTLDDVCRFQKEFVKGSTFKYMILGDENELDMDALRKIAPVKRVSTEEIFGY